jgi:hypothetical protein
MSNACCLKLFEIIQHYLIKGLVTVTNFSVLVFQIDGIRLVKLVIQEISISELSFNDYCLIRRELQSLERRDFAVCFSSVSQV